MPRSPKLQSPEDLYDLLFSKTGNDMRSYARELQNGPMACRGATIISLKVLIAASFAFILAATLILGTNSVVSIFQKGFELLPILKVEKSGKFLRVADSPGLEPEVGKSFILASWFRLRRLPREGERMVLLSKFDPEVRSQRGYSLTLIREEGNLRPMVYWKNPEAQGGSFKFSEFNIKKKEWFLLGLSFSEGTKLGLHLVTIGDEGKANVSLLGGYELSTPVIPSSTSDLFIGSWAKGSFRGQIGSVLILSSEEKMPPLSRVFKRLAESPSSLPAGFDEQDVQIWLRNSARDEGPKQIPVSEVSTGEKTTLRKEKAGEKSEQSLKNEKESADLSASSKATVKTDNSKAVLNKKKPLPKSGTEKERAALKSGHAKVKKGIKKKGY